MKILQIITLSVILMGCATPEKLKPSAQMIEIDGSDSDWPKLVHYGKDAGILYEVTYDKDYLYVLAKTFNESGIQRIMTSGLTVWVDANGKKKKKMGIKYPVLRKAPPKERGKGESNLSLEALLEEGQLNNIILQGVESDDVLLMQKNELKIDLDVMIGFDAAKNLLYEMKIPLTLLEQKAKKELSTIAIGIEVLETARPANGNRPPEGEGGGGNRSGGGPPGGGGGGRSGGGGPPGGSGGGGAPSGGQSSTVNQAYIFWSIIER